MPITALTTSDQCGGMHAEGRGAGGTRGGGGGSRQLYKGRSDRHRAVACWPEPVLYSPGGIVLPDIQQLFLTNLEYLYVWVPSCRALPLPLPLPLLGVCVCVCVCVAVVCCGLLYCGVGISRGCCVLYSAALIAGQSRPST